MRRSNKSYGYGSKFKMPYKQEGGELEDPMMGMEEDPMMGMDMDSDPMMEEDMMGDDPTEIVMEIFNELMECKVAYLAKCIEMANIKGEENEIDTAATIQDLLEYKEEIMSRLEGSSMDMDMDPMMGMEEDPMMMGMEDEEEEDDDEF